MSCEFFVVVSHGTQKSVVHTVGTHQYLLGTLGMGKEGPSLTLTDTKGWWPEWRYSSVICMSSSFLFVKFPLTRTAFINREEKDDMKAGKKILLNPYQFFPLERSFQKPHRTCQRKTGLVSRNILRIVCISQREPRFCFLRTLAAVPQW